MFVHPRQTDELMSKYKEISKYQLVVTRPANRDEMALVIEFAQKPGDMKKWEEELVKDFQGACKVRFDKMEIVPAGTIAEETKKIVDKRTY